MFSGFWERTIFAVSYLWATHCAAAVLDKIGILLTKQFVINTIQVTEHLSHILHLSSREAWRKESWDIVDTF